MTRREEASDASSRAGGAPVRHPWAYPIDWAGWVLATPQQVATAEKIPSEIKRAMLAAVDIMAPPSTEVQSSRQPSLDDLRTALEMLRTIVTDLGAELYLDEAGIVRARIIL